jgi:KTSC domain
MKLSRLDLGNVVAIGHASGYLQVLLQGKEDLELLEIEAPIQAYEGLQQLNNIVAAASGNALPSAPESIAMLPVHSSMANALGYDEENQILQVEFNSGEVYQYTGVEPEIWEDLQETESIGKYFNHEIKGNYQSERVDDNYC